MRVFINKETSVKFEVEEDKAKWFEGDSDFVEFFEEPEPVTIKPKKKKITVKKAKVIKKVTKKEEEK